MEYKSAISRVSVRNNTSIKISHAGFLFQKKYYCTKCERRISQYYYILIFYWYIPRGVRRFSYNRLFVRLIFSSPKSLKDLEEVFDCVAFRICLPNRHLVFKTLIYTFNFLFRTFQKGQIRSFRFHNVLRESYFFPPFQFEIKFFSISIKLYRLQKNLLLLLATDAAKYLIFSMFLSRLYDSENIYSPSLSFWLFISDLILSTRHLRTLCYV